MTEERIHIRVAREEIKKYLAGNYTNETDETRNMVRFLLWSAILGPDEKAIAVEANLTTEEASRWADRARDQGIWEDDRVVADWFETDGGMALTLDVCVLQGLMEKKRR